MLGGGDKSVGEVVVSTPSKVTTILHAMHMNV